MTPDEISGQSETQKTLQNEAKAAAKKNPKTPQYQFDNSGDALSRIRGRQLPDLQMGEGPGTQRITESTQYLRDTPQGRVSTAQYAGPREATQYIRDLQRGLGLKGPQSALDATRRAATMQLEQGTLEQAVRDSQQLAAQGQSTGSRSQALSALRGQTLAGQKAGLEADLQQDEAARMAAYESQLLEMAQQQAGALTSADQEAARVRTQGSFANAQAEANRQLEKAKMSLTSGEALNAEEYKRRMAEYGNALAQVQQLNTADILEINKNAQTQQNWMDFVSGLANAGARVGTAAI